MPLAVATFRTTKTSAKVNRNSATRAGTVATLIGATAAPAFKYFTAEAASMAPTICEIM